MSDLIPEDLGNLAWWVLIQFTWRSNHVTGRCNHILSSLFSQEEENPLCSEEPRSQQQQSWLTGAISLTKRPPVIPATISLPFFEARRDPHWVERRDGHSAFWQCQLPSGLALKTTGLLFHPLSPANLLTWKKGASVVNLLPGLTVLVGSCKRCCFVVIFIFYRFFFLDTQEQSPYAAQGWSKQSRLFCLCRHSLLSFSRTDLTDNKAQV